MTETCEFSIDEIAAFWWLRQQEGLDRTQYAAMQAWLAADPRHAQAFEAMQQTSASLSRLRQAQTRPATVPKPRRTTRHVLALACSLLLCVWLVWQYQPDKADYQNLLQSKQTPHDFHLPDGSLIVLDQASEAKVVLYPDRREVELSRGQALFDVRKDARRPFIIKAGENRITVLGTRFSVRNDQDDVRVDVANGLVKVSNEQMTRLLGAGEGMRISQGNWLPTRQIAADSVASWQQQRLVFDNTPLPEALAEFSRYGAPPVRLAEERLQGLRVTGSFRHDQPAQFLKLLPEVLPVRLVNRQGQLTVHPR